MKAQPMRSPFGAMRSQRGIATILIVVLVGVALTATAMGIMHSIRSTQEKQVAVHAATHAQTGVWTGAEALRRYFETLTPTSLKALSGNIPMTVGDNAYGNMSANVTSVDETANSFKVTATIVNKHGDANSSAAVGVVYEVEKIDPCPGCVKLTASLDFHDDLMVAGGIQFVTPANTLATINVDGNITMPGIEINKLGVLNATGSVDLDSQVQVGEINSNDDVTLKGAAYADKVTTRGRVTTVGGAGAGIVWANKAVTLGSSYNIKPLTSENVNSRANININMGNHGNFKAGGAVTIGGAGSVGDIQAVGNIAVNSNTTIGNAVGKGNFTCPSTTWNTFTSIKVDGTLNGCSTLPTWLTSVLTGGSNDVTVMNEVQPITIPRLVIDVYTLKQYANYVFEYDTTKGRTKVTVNNIKGIANGSVFYVGNYGGSENSYLCTTFTGNSAWDTCTAPTTNKAAICLGHSVYNACLHYNTSTNTWTFDGTSTAPGIMWFKGNVALNNGYNYSTILAAGNVSTGGSMRNVSVNYAGFSEICKATGANIPNVAPANLRNSYNSLFKDRYPTNLCDMTNNKYLPINAGNIGIAAGGYDTAGNGTFSGGEINLGASTIVYGAVLAGSYLFTAGDSTVYGYVSAAVREDMKGGKDNSLGGKTTVDTSVSTADYNPAVIPDMTGGKCPDCGGMSGAKIGASKLLWSKYM